ncbi:MULTISPECIES: glycosyltransferase family 2 protein [Pseudanabaena]|uniref:Glycosyl transferase family 2 n=2 Tax=Pseudanabaena TaxID=1152 RepID=L8N781_9CYAN|nr:MULTISPECIES: glycosyltransferase family 2 protein [Pseudanabaena]ELS34555.1 glycosyl transferase family 2 [Pseudanabaena biceps PCC 7429]MDG3493240.1 glycosyltransferase family 2 protein [Pseudanabaena catenata USMAC16]
MATSRALELKTSSSSSDIEDNNSALTDQRYQSGCQSERDSPKILVSLLVPAYNESSIIEKNLGILCKYMQSLENKFQWEMVIVNDGSRDDTYAKALEFAKNRENVLVLHHRINHGLGQALRYGFKNCQGDYIVVVDLDLSYSADHIGDLLDRIVKTQARIVVASPYMRGGSISNVPWLRKTLSIWANRFLSFTDKRSLATLTGMVRVYDAQFLKRLNLRSKGMEINPEIIHKARLLGVRVEEIPAHLCWLPQKTEEVKRVSSMKIAKQTTAVLVSGFLFRPVIFFLIPSLILFLLSAYADFYAMLRSWHNYQQLALSQQFPDFTDAIAMAYSQAPHTFFIGGITLILAIQLFSLGVLSMQSKNYFEEIFYLGTAIYENNSSIKNES